MIKKRPGLEAGQKQPISTAIKLWTLNCSARGVGYFLYY